MSLNNKKIKLSKEEFKKLAEAVKDLELKVENNKKIVKPLEENKFLEKNIKLEKISPVLKPVAKTQEGLEQIPSSFLLQKKQEENSLKKPYESENQKYLSQSSEYKTLNKTQTENLQTPLGFEKNMAHMGVEQSTKKKSQNFFENTSEKEYKNFMYDKSEK